MCEHRTPGRWGQTWTYYLVAVLGSFGVLEGVALATEGTPATLSAYLRRLAGLHPSCRHAPCGRAALLALLMWMAAHLGWGVLGVGGGLRGPARVPRAGLPGSGGEWHAADHHEHLGDPRRLAGAAGGAR